MKCCVPIVSLVCATACLSAPVLARTAAPLTTVSETLNPNTRITLDIAHPTLNAVVQALGQQYGINIMSDAYLAEGPTLPALKIDNVPLQVALPRIASVFGRQMGMVDGIVIWRDKKPWFRASQDDFLAEHYQAVWPGPGFVTLTKGDDFLAPPKQVSTLPPGPLSASVRPAPPITEAPRMITITAGIIPVKEFAARFTKATEWPVQIDPALANRRVNAYLLHVTPSQTLEALTRVMQVSETVAIGETDAQKRQREQQLADMSDTRSPREKLSDALKQKLLTLLTDQQKAALATGNNKVPFAVSALSPDLRVAALQYIAAAYQEVKSALPNSLDKSKFGTFTLEFPPDGQGIGVSGTDANGGAIGF